MLTPQETVDAANDLVGGYDFNQALADYNWPNGTPLKVAWNQRHTLENLPIGLDYAQQVHQWGFGGMEIPHAVTNNPNFADALHAFLQAWSAMPQNAFPYPAAPNCDRAQTLIELLSIHGLGIARVSKWACFINQNHYAIYDSRVAYALRHLHSGPANDRIFPFVAGRSAPAGHPPRVNQDNLISDPRRATTAFINFLLVIREAANALNAADERQINAANQLIVGPTWTPGLVEMALFQLGNTRARTPGIARVNGVLNHPWP